VLVLVLVIQSCSPSLPQAALDLTGTFAKAGRPAANNPDIVRVNASEGGNSAAYLAARLKKAGGAGAGGSALRPRLLAVLPQRLQAALGDW